MNQLPMNLSTLIDVFNVDVPEQLRKLVDEPINEDLMKKNKYANNAEYVPESVYKKILNKISGYKWSFLPVWYGEKGEGKGAYMEFIGLLIVPGFGVHTGIGSCPLNKGNNQNALAAAKTYALKNACKEMGLAPNVGDDDWDQPIFETEVEEVIEEKRKEIEKNKKKKPKDKSKSKSSDSESGDLPKDLRKQIKELREAYELESDDDLVAFLQIWNEEILDPDEMDETQWRKFFKYFEKNKEEFEDF